MERQVIGIDVADIGMSLPPEEFMMAMKKALDSIPYPFPVDLKRINCKDGIHLEISFRRLEVEGDMAAIAYYWRRGLVHERQTA